jgi:hypothetical protein
MRRGVSGGDVAGVRFNANALDFGCYVRREPQRESSGVNRTSARPVGRPVKTQDRPSDAR